MSDLLYVARDVARNLLGGTRIGLRDGSFSGSPGPQYLETNMDADPTKSKKPNEKYKTYQCMTSFM